ncbi:hypothetical protein QBC35DRAFT_456050 [Podospora australis]|uniref:UBC core domain-containing protein n=1 Tax=Podospora australis TaxID=1536484 RepID=A0AAN6WKT9_9PEZI|nr:hypothetical protein QBC35DRAFT_456050 [Podospora australis]
MSPFRNKLEKGMQKMQGILRPSKRRISEDNEPTKHQKQPRKTTKSKPGDKSKAIPIHSNPIQSPTPPSTSASESMSNYRYEDTGGPSGLGSSDNPIDLSEKVHDLPGSNAKNPIDLTLEDASAAVIVAKHRQEQIDSDEAMALALQQDFEDELRDPISDRSLAMGCHNPDAPRNINDVSELERWRKDLNAFPCGNYICKEHIIPVKADGLIAEIRKRLEDGYLHPLLRCGNCEVWNCICGKVHGDSKKPKLGPVFTVGEKKGCKITWCCDQGRLFLAFSLLCGFQPSGLVPRPVKPTKSKKTAAPVPPPKFPDLPNSGSGTSTQSYAALQPPPWPAMMGQFLFDEVPAMVTSNSASAFSKGTGYGDHCKMNKTSSLGGLTTQSAIHEASRYFFALSCVLPDPNREKPDVFDHSPHPGLAVLLMRSRMLDLAIQITRSITIQEMDTSADVISGALQFLTTIANHWDLNPVLFCDQVFFPKSEQLHEFTLSKDGSEKKRVEGYETGQSACAVLEQAALRCQVFISGTSKLGLDATQQAGSETRLAKQICELSRGLQVYRDQMGSYLDSVVKPPPKDTSSGTSMSPAPNVITRSRSAKGKEAELASTVRTALTEMAEFHKEQRASEVAAEVFNLDYYRDFSATAAKTSGSKTGSMRKLFAQITSLHTDLPDGIYVRYAEGRPDMLKFIIIGPSNTPYEHGIFEFDMLCHADFPSHPPKVQFKTTNGGRVRFNPNLYENGKVCLSLLGTWDKSSWDPATSTILQVLVSIQSMILIDKPYYNEPGFEHRVNNAQAELYNNNIRSETVTAAILPWLTTDKMLTSIWGDIARKHFELKNSLILETVMTWGNRGEIPGKLAEDLRNSLGVFRGHTAEPKLG